MMAVRFVKLEDFLAEVKKQGVSPIYMSIAAQEGKVGEKRMMSGILHLANICDKYLLFDAILAQKVIEKLEDETKLDEELKTGRTNIETTMRNVCPGILVTEGVAWPL